MTDTPHFNTPQFYDGENFPTNEENRVPLPSEKSPRSPESAAAHVPKPEPVEPKNFGPLATQPRPAPRRADPALLRARRLKKQQGFEFTLRATTDDDGNPMVVRARRPELFDADSLASLPDTHQRAIFDLIDQTQKAENEAQGEDEKASIAGMSVTDMARTFGNLGNIADAYVLLGFIEPKAYATAAEADSKGGLWVKDIEFADRMAFMNHVQDAQGGAASAVATFRPEPDGAVDAGSASPAVSGDGEPLTDRGAAGAM